MRRVSNIWLCFAVFVLLVSITRSAPAQYQYIAPGSTAPGDYLRGVGIEAAGLGTYILDSARATSINTDTAIRWDSYISAALEYEQQKFAEHRAAAIASKHENYRKERERLRENANEFDVRNGSALNDVLEQLLDPKYTDSVYRYAEVPIPVDLIRRIPFKLGEKGVTFSMARLSPRGNGKWPPAFQDDRAWGERQAYEQAVDLALEQAIDRKILDGSIEKIEKAVDGLERRLDDGVIPRNDTRYLEGMQKIRDLRAVAEQLKIDKVETAIGEIDKYSGTTVYDLKILMQKHGLRFGDARLPDEKKEFPELYTVLRQQRDALNGAAKAPAK
jgi:hypothetical protein